MKRKLITLEEAVQTIVGRNFNRRLKCGLMFTAKN